MDIALVPFNIGALLGLGFFTAAAVYTVKDARRQAAEAGRDGTSVGAKPAFDFTSRIEMLVKLGATMPSIGLGVAIMMGR